MKIAAAAVLAVLAAPAEATQEYILPTLFDVTGVTPNDVLNVRARPSADAEIVGTLAPDATRIEVVAHGPNGRWGRVNVDGRSGWVSMRYLAYRTDVWVEGEVPAGLRCLGTEPFWSLDPDGERLVYETPEDERAFSLDAVLSAGTFRSPKRALTGSDGGTRVVATILPAQCSDGMSDRVYGLDATVVFVGEGAPRMLGGCCTLSG